MRVAPRVSLTGEQRQELDSYARSRTAPHRVVLRSRMILLAADGKQNKEIAREVGASEPTVSKTRKKFLANGIPALLKDAPRPGRKPSITHEKRVEIIEATLHSKPRNATHWSTRSMAEHVGVSHMTVQRVWKESNLKPHLVETFKLSRDKRFVEKLTDVVGLYISPPEHALVLCVDEKSQIQALDRTQPRLPIRPGVPERYTHDYKRHGTTTLFAALSMADGKVIAECKKRHRHQEYLAFLKRIDEETPPDLDLHLIVDNYSTHKHERVKRWLAKHPRFQIHFIPTSSSWLNMVERWFREITDKRIRRGSFSSVPELIDAIMDYVEQHNEAPTAFVWSASVERILDKIRKTKESLDTLH